MKKIGLLLLFCIPALLSRSQTLKKITISSSGCSAYVFCDYKFEKQFSEDSSEVYSGECVKDAVSYGIICVRLSQPANDPERAEESMISYLDYLKTSFGITKSAGYGRGHRLNNNESTRGVLDYWEDAEKNNWKVKAWTNGKFIAVLYGYSAKELVEQKLNVFLESFRFPGM